MTDATDSPAGDVLDEEPVVTEAEARTFRRRLARAEGMTVADAARMHLKARRAHLAADNAEAMGDRVGSRLERAEADELEAVAGLAVDSLTHGSVVAGAGEAALAKHPLADTLRAPTDMLPIEASQKRMELAEEAGCLELGLDFAATIGARDSLEKALAHQLGAAHRLAMDMLGQAARLAERFEGTGHVAISIEAGRMANAASRLMLTFQGGMATIARLRSGATQTVVVKHLQQVAVGEGGRAVVAGAVKARTKRRKGEG